MHEWTEKEIEDAVAHDIGILEKHWAEMGQVGDDAPDGQSASLDARLELFEARVDAKLQAMRPDLMRWTVRLFCAAVLLSTLIVRL